MKHTNFRPVSAFGGRNGIHNVHRGSFFLCNKYFMFNNYIHRRLHSPQLTGSARAKMDFIDCHIEWFISNNLPLIHPVIFIYFKISR